MKRWPKLSGTTDCRTHLFLSAKVTVGPSHDIGQAPDILRSALRRVPFRRVLLDAAYDAEKMHVFIRKELGAHSVIPPTAGHPTRKWPKTRYRRQMRRRFPRHVYGQRWQIESTFSRHKRLLGSALRAVTWASQKREIYCRILTHNLMILLSSTNNFSTEQDKRR
jgi:transposase